MAPKKYDTQNGYEQHNRAPGHLVNADWTEQQPDIHQLQWKNEKRPVMVTRQQTVVPVRSQMAGAQRSRYFHPCNGWGFFPGADVASSSEGSWTDLCDLERNQV